MITVPENSPCKLTETFTLRPFDFKAGGYMIFCSSSFFICTYTFVVDQVHIFGNTNIDNMQVTELVTLIES